MKKGKAVLRFHSEEQSKMISVSAMTSLALSSVSLSSESLRSELDIFRLDEFVQYIRPANVSHLSRIDTFPHNAHNINAWNTYKVYSCQCSKTIYYAQRRHIEPHFFQKENRRS